MYSSSVYVELTVERGESDVVIYMVRMKKDAVSVCCRRE